MVRLPCVLVWMDLEMTGLDPRRDQIVEMATLVTDDQLNIVATGPQLVIAAPEQLLASMDPYVLNMHTTSGLLESIRASSVTLASAEEQTLAFLKSSLKSAKSAPLCGNTIGTDRRFLAEQTPSVEEYLHYRSVDVTSIKELARRWNPEVSSGAPAKKRGHRALDDIMESIEELRYYRDSFFRITGS